MLPDNRRRRPTRATSSFDAASDTTISLAGSDAAVDGAVDEPSS